MYLVSKNLASIRKATRVTKKKPLNRKISDQTKKVND